MSRIFDALQELVAEELAGELQSPLPPVELLKFTERSKATVYPEAVLDGDPSLQNTNITAQSEAVWKRQESVQTGADAPLNATPQPKDVAVDPFSQFQSLPFLVSPQSRIVCITDRESLAAEKFRYVSMRLLQLRQKRAIKKVLITSTIPNAGNSMVAANLACALAQEKAEKVLLLDGNLRRPSLARLFGLETPMGMSEWLLGDAPPSKSIFHLEAGDCWIMPAGNTPQNPLELMQSSKLSALLEQLIAWFDWIVIDSLPVLPLPDTSIWMRHADGVLLVTREGTETDSQERGLVAVEPSKLLGTILNCSTATPS